jgi:hypothetical protein
MMNYPQTSPTMQPNRPMIPPAGSPTARSMAARQFAQQQGAQNREQQQGAAGDVAQMGSPVLGGLIGALITGIASGGNPAAAMAGAQAGSKIGGVVGKGASAVVDPKRRNLQTLHGMYNDAKGGYDKLGSMQEAK